jgi:cation transport ATPase
VTRGRTSGDPQPDEAPTQRARVLRDGARDPADEVEISDVIIVRPGNMPVDGVVWTDIHPSTSLW